MTTTVLFGSVSAGRHHYELDHLQRVMTQPARCFHDGLVTEHHDVIMPVAGCAHQTDTCRLGTDAAISVLDVNGKARELDNRYVVDMSFFPSIGAVNPALTAMANAIRIGEDLLGRMS